MKKWLPFIILLTVFLLPHIDLFSQGCSMCAATAKGAASEEDNSRGEQLNIGILYLMAVPYILIFLVFRKKIVAFFRELGGVYKK
jgi:hypothetical protein